MNHAKNKLICFSCWTERIYIRRQYPTVELLLASPLRLYPWPTLEYNICRMKINFMNQKYHCWHWLRCTYFTVDTDYAVRMSLSTLTTLYVYHCRHWLRCTYVTVDTDYAVRMSLSTLTTLYVCHCRHWLRCTYVTVDTDYAVRMSLSSLTTLYVCHCRHWLRCTYFTHMKMWPKIISKHMLWNVHVTRTNEFY